MASEEDDSVKIYKTVLIFAWTIFAVFIAFLFTWPKEISRVLSSAVMHVLMLSLLLASGVYILVCLYRWGMDKNKI